MPGIHKIDSRVLHTEARINWTNFEKSHRAVKHVEIWLTTATTARRIFFASNPNAMFIDPSTIFLIIQVLMFLYRLWADRNPTHAFKVEDDITLIEAKLAEYAA